MLISSCMGFVTAVLFCPCPCGTDGLALSAKENSPQGGRQVNIPAAHPKIDSTERRGEGKRVEDRRGEGRIREGRGGWGGEDKRGEGRLGRGGEGRSAGEDRRREGGEGGEGGGRI